MTVNGGWLVSWRATASKPMWEGRGFLKWILDIAGCISSMLRLKQICLVAADLDPVEEQLKEILGLEVAYSDPGLSQFGLKNIMLPIGNGFLEVVTPVEENTTAGRFLERRDGDGGDPRWRTRTSR